MLVSFISKANMVLEAKAIPRATPIFVKLLLPHPVNHLLIKINLLCVISTEVSHAYRSLCWLINVQHTTRLWILSTDHDVIGKCVIPADMSNAFGLLSCCTQNSVCFTNICFATTSTMGNSTLQGRLKPSYHRFSRINVSSHWHMT